MITCAICGKQYLYIAPKHAAGHGITQAEYASRYGEIYSPEYKTRRSQISIRTNEIRFSDPAARLSQGLVMAENNRNVHDYPGWLENTRRAIREVTTLESRRKGQRGCRREFWDKLKEEDPEKYYSMMRVPFEAQSGIMTRPERILENELVPLGFRYTGCTRSFRLGRMNPDFVHDFLKVVVEHFGDYWHPVEDEEKRVRKFQSIGYDCVVIWEHEVYNSIGSAIDRVKEVLHG